MQLYFGSLAASEHEFRPNNIVTFSIPDIGVMFKAPFSIEDYALDYASLLTLLEFIDINPQLFANKALELYTHNPDIVRQMRTCTIERAELAPYLHKALEYREKLHFSLNLIARPDNPAQRPEID
jgi:hypothetical protein